MHQEASEPADLTLATIQPCFSGEAEEGRFSLETAVLLRDEKRVQLIDARAPEYFNGWPEPGATRGGHLPGATSFYADWIDELPQESLRQLLVQKDLDPSAPTLVYGSENSTGKLTEALLKFGFSYVAATSQPVSNFSGELNALPRFEKLVSVRWLRQLLDKGNPESAPSEDYKLIEVGLGAAEEYRLSHIPGALYLDTNDIEGMPWWNCAPPNKLARVAAGLGITNQTPVILYGRDSIAAARTAVIMMYMGVEDVRLVDGGLEAWSKAGFAGEAGINHTRPETDFGSEIPARRNLIVDTDQVKELLAQPESGSLVSIRSWNEYIGETSGYNYIRAKGRIPGARWGRAGSDPNHMQSYRNPGNTMRSANEIEAFWNERGIHSAQRVSFYCGTGWRASEAFFYAWVMGWNNISLYDGGWYQWSSDTSNPVASGEPATDAPVSETASLPQDTQILPQPAF